MKRMSYQAGGDVELQVALIAMAQRGTFGQAPHSTPHFDVLNQHNLITRARIWSSAAKIAKIQLFFLRRKTSF
jgi:hypothetical protein